MRADETGSVGSPASVDSSAADEVDAVVGRSKVADGDDSAEGSRVGRSAIGVPESWEEADLTRERDDTSQAETRAVTSAGDCLDERGRGEKSAVSDADTELDGDAGIARNTPGGRHLAGQANLGTGIESHEHLAAASVAAVTLDSDRGVNEQEKAGSELKFAEPQEMQDSEKPCVGGPRLCKVPGAGSTHGEALRHSFMS